MLCPPLQALLSSGHNSVVNQSGPQSCITSSVSAASPNKSQTVGPATLSQRLSLAQKNHRQKDRSTDYVKRLKRPKCADMGCHRSAYFNVEGSMSGMYCAKHKVAGMVDVLNPRCQANGCKKRQVYNVKGAARGLFCGDHKKPGMVNVASPRCQHDKCGTIANFNTVGAKGVRFCSAHAVLGMVDRYSKRCEESGCNVFANYGVAGSSHKCFCAGHKTPLMVSGKSLIKKIGSI